MRESHHLFIFLVRHRRPRVPDTLYVGPAVGKVFPNEATAFTAFLTANWTGSVPVAEGGVKRDFMLRRCYVWDSDMLRQMSSPVLAS